MWLGLRKLTLSILNTSYYRDYLLFCNYVLHKICKFYWIWSDKLNWEGFSPDHGKAKCKLLVDPETKTNMHGFICTCLIDLFQLNNWQTTWINCSIFNAPFWKSNVVYKVTSQPFLRILAHSSTAYHHSILPLILSSLNWD